MKKNDIHDIIDARVLTSIPAEVTKVNDYGTLQTVSVRVLVNEPIRGYLALQGAEITSVPVLFPSAGGGILSFPIKVGDTVLLSFTHTSIGEWMVGDGSAATPDTLRKFNLADAVAIPSLYTQESNLKPNTEDVELRFKESTIRITPTGDIMIKGSRDIQIAVEGDARVIAEGDASVTGDNVSVSAAGDLSISAVGAISASARTFDITSSTSFKGDVAIAGRLTNNGINVGSSHRHSGVTSGSAVTREPL